LAVVAVVVDEIVVGDFRAVHLAFVHLLVGRLVLVGGRCVVAGVFLALVVFLLVAARLVLVLGRLRIIRFGFVLAILFGDVHRGEHVAHDAGEGLLVVDGGRKPVHVLAG